MSPKVHDGYEVTSKSIDSKLAEQKKGSQEEKFLKKLKEEKFKLHLQKQDEAEQTLSPEEIEQQRQEEQKLIAEKMLKEQEKKRKIEEKSRQGQSETVLPVSFQYAVYQADQPEIIVLEQKQFNLGQQPNSSVSNPKSTNLETQKVAKHHDNENGGNAVGH